MGQFNVLVEVKSEATFLEANLALELERTFGTWRAPDRFDHYAIGVSDGMRFGAYWDRVEGWIDNWHDDDEADKALTQEEWTKKVAQWSLKKRPGYVLVPVRCHG